MYKGRVIMAILSFSESSCNNVTLQIGTHAESAVACMTIRAISSGIMKVALNRHEFNPVQISTWLVTHTARFFKMKKGKDDIADIT